MTTLKDRFKQGKEARKNCPRSTHAKIGKTERDPLPLIKASSEGPIRSLVELRYGRMPVSLFLQFKEARRSVLADYVRTKSRVRHNGQRVVDGQRLMQSASDLFLGWTTDPSGRHFCVRQLRDMKVSAELETFDADAFANLLACYAISSNLTAPVNLNNVFDREYDSSQALAGNYGAPRNIMTSFKYVF